MGKIRGYINIVKRFVDYFIIGLLLVGNLLLVWRLFSVPFSFVFSAPVVPFLARSLGLFGVEFDSAVRWLLLVFFIFGSVTLYFLVREITGRRMSAVVAAVLYSLPIFRSRFEAMVLLGDGAHIAALTLIPFVTFWVLEFLRRGSYRAGVVACLSVFVVALTSPFGLFALMGFLLVVTFSEMLLGYGRLKFARFLVLLVFSAGLSAFWYNPEFVRLTLTSPSGRAVIAAIKNLIPISFFTLPILGAFGFLIFDRRQHLQPLFVALGLTVVFGLISFAGGLARFAVTEQSRYLPELGLSLSVLWGIIGTFVYDLIPLLPKSKWFPIPKSKRGLVRRVSVWLFVLLCIVSVLVFPFAKDLDRRVGRQLVGITTSVVIDISEIREQTGIWHRIFGYTISAITAIGLVVLGRVLTKQEVKKTGIIESEGQRK